MTVNVKKELAQVSNSSAVIVFKDKKSRQVLTYVNIDGHGAQVSIEDFVSLLAETYGSPATTFTKKAFAKALQDAAEQVVRQMKSQTKEIAAVSLEPDLE